MRVRAMLVAGTLCSSLVLAQSASKVRVATPDRRSSWIDDSQIFTDEPMGKATWLGLYRQGSGYEWRSTEARLVWAPDPFSDENNSTKWSGKKLFVSDGTRPLIMVQGLDALAETQPRRADYAGKEAFPGLGIPVPENGLRIRWDGTSFVLKGLHAGPRRRLTLIAGSGSQVVDTMFADSDSGWDVLWAGDLDGDGRLDLIVSGTDGKVSSCLHLLLSSQAKPRELVHQVAERRYAGD